MAVLTAGTSIKDDFLPGIDEPAEVGAGVFTDAADEEYRRDARYVIEDSHAMLLEKTITKKEFDTIMNKCRDREYVREVAERKREWANIRGYCGAKALELGITEEVINEEIRLYRSEKRGNK